MVDFEKVLNDAVAAAGAEALRIWNRDEQQDRGSCGGAVMIFDKRSKLAKAAQDKAIVFEGCYLNVRGMIPEGIKSQNADIEQGAAYAFKKVIEDAGCGNAIKKFWTYVD